MVGNELTSIFQSFKIVDVAMSSFFSIVIPTHNSESLIIECLDSILCQSYRSFEICIVDDGSTDQTAEIIDIYTERFRQEGIIVKLDKNEKNLGASITRNKALEMCRGKWICFMDSDDMWKHNKLEELEKCIQRNVEVSFITHNEEFWDLETNKRIGKLVHNKKSLNRVIPANSLRKDLYWSNFVSTSATCISRQLLGFERFDPELKNGQDYELWLRLFSSQDFLVYGLDMKLGRYNKRKGSITSQFYGKRIKAMVVIAWRYRRLVGNKIFVMKVMKLLASLNGLRAFLVFTNGYAHSNRGDFGIA